jgi:hypothetical protein
MIPDSSLYWGMQDLATVDTILLNELPAVEDKEAVSACS